LRLRDGWCAFRIELTRDHFIFSDRLALQCIVSGTAVHLVEFDTVVWNDQGVASSRPRPMPLDELIFPRTGTVQADISAYQPLIDRLAATLSDEQYVVFAFRLILGRDPDVDGRETYLSMIGGGGDRNALLLALLNSEEFTRTRRGQLPSPFDETFPAVPLFLPLE